MSAIRAGQAYVEFFVKDEEMRKKILEASAQMREMGDKMQTMALPLMKIGGLITAPLAAASKLFADIGDNMNTLAKRAGISVEELSKLKYAIEQTGGSIDDINIGFKGMANFIDDASKGGKISSETIKRLGLSVDELQRLKPDERFLAIAEALSFVKDDSEQAAIAQDVFGKSAYNLLPSIRAGTDELRLMMDQAQKLGLVMSTKDAEAADALKDKMTELGSQFKMVAFNIGASLQPMLMDLAKTIQGYLPSITTWIKTNGELIKTLGVTGVSILSIGSALYAIGAIIKGGAGVIAAFKSLSIFLAANPWVLLAVAIGAVALKLNDMAGSGERAAAAFADIRKQTQAETDDLEKQGKAIDRLIALNEKKNLTGVEELEQKKLKDQLTMQFGDISTEEMKGRNAIELAKKRQEAAKAELQALENSEEYKKAILMEGQSFAGTNWDETAAQIRSDAEQRLREAKNRYTSSKNEQTTAEGSYNALVDEIRGLRKDMSTKMDTQIKTQMTEGDKTRETLSDYGVLE